MQLLSQKLKNRDNENKIVIESEMQLNSNVGKGGSALLHVAIQVK